MVAVIRPARRSRGFTLVELLVVLAILVLLFGLLFAPMMTSLDMAKQGQARARMQDTIRHALEDIQRTVSNALYVLPMRLVYPATAPNLAYVDTSRLLVISPQAGVLTSPLQPATRPDAVRGVNWMEAVRYVVHPRSGRIVRNDDDPVTLSNYAPGTTVSLAGLSSTLEYQPTFEDPFVLYRQTGIWFEVTPGNFAFGKLDGSGNFITNEPYKENALSLGDGYDVPCSTSVCDNCGARYPGFRLYSTICSTCGFAAGYTYLFDSVKFTPQSAPGEQLAPLEDGTIYRAQHGGWTGYAQLDPTALCPQLYERRMDPRIVVYRFDPATGAYDELQYDSYAAGARGTPTLSVAWDRDAGAVKFGRVFEQIITLTDSGGSVSGATFNDEATVVELDPYGSPTAPTGYAIDPTPNAIILPDTVTVRALVNLAAGAQRWVDYGRTDQFEQHQIGDWQFAVRRPLPPAAWEAWLPENWATSMDILFNDANVTGPPSPAKFAKALGVPLNGVSSVELHIRYWARRNADIHRGATATGRDDTVRMDYNTRNVIDVNLTLSEFVDYIEDGNENYTLSAPPPMTQQATLHDTIVVRNAGR